MALLAGLLALACAVPARPPAPAPPEPLPAPAPEPLPAARPQPPCERIVAIQVFKSERRLVAECEGGAEVTLRVALGRDPVGPKRHAGDLRTPEGSYHVTGPARPSRFHRFLPIDYPSPADADAGLAEGLIDAAQHRRILRAHEAGFPPPADTPLGSGLGFHGEGARWRGDSSHLDWTTGCIAMTDDEIELLAGRVAPGTPVTIHP